MLTITGRCSATKVILWVRHHSQISIAKLHSGLEWASLFDWCKSLPKYCLTWLGQCNDSDLSQNSWELGILLVVPDNLADHNPLFDPDHLWPLPQVGGIWLYRYFYPWGKRWGSLETPWATIKNPLALLYSFAGYLTQVLCWLGK